MIKMDQPAPNFEGVTAYQNGEFKKISLVDYKGKWLVFFFYPRDFTFVCPTELRAFAAQEEAFHALDAQVLAASTDSEWSHKAWFERDLPEIKFPILADTNHAITQEYDLLNEQDGSAHRGLFIIDPEGNIKYALVNTEAVGRSVDETIRVLEALQTGEKCPANWKKGLETLGIKVT